MVCYTGKSNQLKPLGDISGVSLSCIAPLSGSFLGDIPMKRIPSTRGKFALVDDEDYEWLMQWKWYAQRGGSTFYAARTVCNDGPRHLIYMHRIIVNCPRNMQVDHVDHNGLDDRKINIINFL